ncbi:MAG: MFS transporter [Oscillospiraceae bacterium]
MNHLKNFFKSLSEMRSFLTLWLSQSFSALGSSMTAYALVIWSYGNEGSALATALLMVSSYAPYVILSIFAGALSDRWNKKLTMLICDSIAAITTVLVLILMYTNTLELWHIYAVNLIGGIMNTFQQPASEVAVTRLLPEKHYQRVGGLRYLSNSVNTILTPVIATAVLGIFGIHAVLCFDLFTFAAAFLTLLFFIKIPENSDATAKESFTSSVKSGVNWLRQQRGVFTLILFLAAINLVASMYEAALPAMMLSRNGGSEQALGIFNTVVGITTLLGSILASALKAPKSRIRVICASLLFSMSTENFLLAFGNNIWVWCLGGFLGWIFIPLMSTNLEAILRTKIPDGMQGRVYSVRNSFQFFTIPLGYLAGGAAVDHIFEPLMQNAPPFLSDIFGTGKGSGAALFYFVIAFAGIAVCLIFSANKHLRSLEKTE